MWNSIIFGRSYTTSAVKFELSCAFSQPLKVLVSSWAASSVRFIPIHIYLFLMPYNDSTSECYSCTSRTVKSSLILFFAFCGLQIFCAFQYCQYSEFVSNSDFLCATENFFVSSCTAVQLNISPFFDFSYERKWDNHPSFSFCTANTVKISPFFSQVLFFHFSVKL